MHTGRPRVESDVSATLKERGQLHKKDEKPRVRRVVRLKARGQHTAHGVDESTGHRPVRSECGRRRGARSPSAALSRRSPDDARNQEAAGQQPLAGSGVATAPETSKASKRVDDKKSVTEQDTDIDRRQPHESTHGAHPAGDSPEHQLGKRQALRWRRINVNGGPTVPASGTDGHPAGTPVEDPNEVVPESQTRASIPVDPSLPAYAFYCEKPAYFGIQAESTSFTKDEAKENTRGRSPDNIILDHLLIQYRKDNPGRLGSELYTWEPFPRSRLTGLEAEIAESNENEKFEPVRRRLLGQPEKLGTLTGNNEVSEHFGYDLYNIMDDYHHALEGDSSFRGGRYVSENYGRIFGKLMDTGRTLSGDTEQDIYTAGPSGWGAKDGTSLKSLFMLGALWMEAQCTSQMDIYRERASSGSLRDRVGSRRAKAEVTYLRDTRSFLRDIIDHFGSGSDDDMNNVSGLLERSADIRRLGSDTKVSDRTVAEAVNRGYDVPSYNHDVVVRVTKKYENTISARVRRAFWR